MFGPGYRQDTLIGEPCIARTSLIPTGTPASTVKVGKSYRATIHLGTPEDASVAIVAGPPGLEWKGSDLVWEVPADFPSGPVPVVVTATQSSGSAASFGFLIDVQE